MVSRAAKRFAARVVLVLGGWWLLLGDVGALAEDGVEFAFGA